MRTKAVLLVFVSLLAACAPLADGGLQTAAPAALATASPDAALVDIKCPLNAAQAGEVASLLPRVFADGRCRLHFQPANDNTLTGVTLVYSEGWIVSLVNPDGTALLFELAGRVLFFQAYRSDLPLERAEEVTYRLEGSPVEPVVNPEEVVKDKVVQEVEGKETLVLTTAMSGQTIRRYFLSHAAPGRAPALYMFQLTVLAPNLDNTALIGAVERMIADLQFDP